MKPLKKILPKGHKWQCQEEKCNNKGYGLDWFSPTQYQVECKKHYYHFVKGVELND